MTTLRTLLRDRALAELNTSRPDGIPEITKNRWMPGQSNVAPSMAVIFIDEPVDPKQSRGFPLSKRNLTLGVECVVSAELPELTDDLVEPMLSWAVTVLGDTQLAGLAIEVEELTTVWETAQMDRCYLRATARFRIEYQTRRNDLSQTQ